MAFFKFRLPERAAAPAVRRDPPSAQNESVEVIRRRAKHRLIGATVLVLVAVIGFPLVFDTQPRPVSVEVPITIPDRNSVKPLAIPAASSVPAAVVEAKPAVSPTPEAISKPAPAPAEVVKPAAATPPARPPVRQVEKIEKAEKVEKPTPVPPAPVKPAARPDDGNRARALLEGRESVGDVGASDDRLVIQVGAFADAVKAREVRQKLERAGLKTYTQVVDGQDGKRIRVRVGPYANRAEADKAAARVRKLDLPASVLTL